MFLELLEKPLGRHFRVRFSYYLVDSGTRAHLFLEATGQAWQKAKKDQHLN